MEQVVLAEFGDPNVGPPQLRLHYVRAEMTQARREFPLQDILRRRLMQRIGLIVFPGFQVTSCAVISAFELANREMGEPVY